MRCGNCGNELRGDARFCSKCGAAVPPSHSAPPPAGAFGDSPRAPFGDAPRAQLSGVGQPARKSGCGKALLVLSIIGLLIIVGLGVAGYFAYRFTEGKLKSSEAYTHAVAKLKADPVVAERMGAIRETGFPLGNFEEKADGTGSAEFRISVTGERDSGNYDVQMVRENRRWRLYNGWVTVKNGQKIMIEPDEAGEPAEPPAPVAPPAAPARGATGAGKTVPGGVLNAKAISKPQPVYPAIAKAARASGTVVVQITVDESGNVISATAISGHPLLRPAAEAAGRQARFSPTLLSGKPVKVTGTITYNFNLTAEPQQQQ